MNNYFSVWETMKAGETFTAEKMIAEFDNCAEAEQLYKRLLNYGGNVRLAGPHERMDTEGDIPLYY